MKYIICQESSIHTLITAIEAELLRGAKPLGGVSVIQVQCGDFILTQALTYEGEGHEQ